MATQSNNNKRIAKNTLLLCRITIHDVCKPMIPQELHSFGVVAYSI